MSIQVFTAKNDTCKIEVDALEDGGIAIAMFEDYLDQYADVVLTPAQTATLVAALQNHINKVK